MWYLLSDLQPEVIRLLRRSQTMDCQDFHRLHCWHLIWWLVLTNPNAHPLWPPIIHPSRALTHFWETCSIHPSQAQYTQIWQGFWNIFLSTNAKVCIYWENNSAYIHFFWPWALLKFLFCGESKYFKYKYTVTFENIIQFVLTRLCKLTVKTILRTLIVNWTDWYSFKWNTWTFNIIWKASQSYKSLQLAVEDSFLDSGLWTKRNI